MPHYVIDAQIDEHGRISANTQFGIAPGTIKIVVEVADSDEQRLARRHALIEALALLRSGKRADASREQLDAEIASIRSSWD